LGYDDIEEIIYPFKGKVIIDDPFLAKRMDTVSQYLIERFNNKTR